MVSIFLLILIFLNEYVTRKKLSEKKVRTKKLVEIFFDLKVNFKVCFLIALSLAFFKLSLMLYKMILSNSIKTNKVVSDTSLIITTIERLLETTKFTVCWFKDNIITPLLKDSPKGSVLRRLYDKNPICFINLSKMKSEFDFTGKVRFISPSFIELFLAAFTKFKKDAEYFISPIFFEYIMVSIARAIRLIKK